MSTSPEHSAFLSRHDFVLPPGGDFDDKERALLTRYGRWLEALAEGTIPPLTEEQRHFVQAALGECPPRSAFEAAWLKQRQAREANRGSASIGPLEAAERVSRLAEAKKAAEALEAEYTIEREAILDQVRSRLTALDEAYSDLLRAAREEVSNQEETVRKAILLVGATAESAGVRAVWCRGRVSWDTAALDRYAADHPEVADFRRVGSPSVQIRYRDGK
jgi:hypothetical protein